VNILDKNYLVIQFYLKKNISYEGKDYYLCSKNSMKDIVCFEKMKGVSK